MPTPLSAPTRPRTSSLSKRLFASSALLILFALSAAVYFTPSGSAQSKEATGEPTPGSLQVLDSKGNQRGFCPLRHTDVRADIAGFLARVNVTQEFENPFDEKIEAVYTFPLPQSAAVDSMTLKVGERTVKGKIMRREEAQAVYESARSAGQVASLLDQERPNVFTQSVANIMPGERVTVTISYVETLKYEAGTYEFSFPTVVGPRYVPGTPQPQDGGKATGTDRVPDASRVAPPVMPKDTRAGHDISIEVSLDAGLPVEELKSVSHEVEVERRAPARARVRLKNLSSIPNKDFVLRYDVAGKKIGDALITHRGQRGGYFTLILQPPERVTVEDVTPKELVFVLDTSGSMEGFPIEKAKETMKLALGGLNPQDTFNLITFAGDTYVLFPEPVPATPANLARAQRFLESRAGGGSTEMMKAIKAALDPTDSRNHVRIVCFMTDGYVGNEMEIISEVQKHPNARVFSFGIGGSVNRFLLDKMAEHGRGEVEYVSLSDDGSAAARRFHERVRNPLLTDITIDWGGLPVADVYPKSIPDLFSAKPVVLTGRFTGAGRGVVRLKGRMGGNAFEREIEVTLPESQEEHDVLATLWARRRVEDLMSEDYAGTQRGRTSEDLREAVTSIGLEYGLMTQFTSFVAVEEMTLTDGGVPRRVEVPVELPEGMASQEGEADKRLMVLNSSGGMASVAGQRTVSSGYLITSQQIQSLPTKSRAPASKPAPSRNLGTTGKAEMEVDVDEAMTIDGTMTEEEARAFESAAALKRKLHPSLAAVVERLKKPDAKPGEGESKFVRDGKADVQIWLTEKTPEVLAQLKQLGFELLLDPKSAPLVIGRLPVEKLAALAELKAVRYVSPQK
ncbi:MAG TPA: VIT domain-containing protein [Pyrinomonadaceae bacterium]|jgi:Ca-activated chloride channel family protein|nr:VIT domain-containing protein [Pyrinomonadaceae bacterium]